MSTIPPASTKEQTMQMPRGTIENSLWIDNARAQAGGDRFAPVDDAASGEVIAEVRSGTASDVDRAFAAARRAQEAWAATDVEERVAVILRAADALEQQTEAIADVLISEVGTVAQQVALTQVGAGLRAMRLTAEAAANAVRHRESIAGSTVVRQAAGVAGAITPWNYPLFQNALKVAPAIAAGCSVVLKPPSIAPLTAFPLAEALASAGLPAGVLNIVCGSGGEIGSAIAAHRDADFVSFTGSVEAGRLVAAAAATRGTRNSLELGGKSAAIVLDELLLEAAVRHTLASSFANTGQTCAALSRLIVPRRLLDQAEAIVADAMRNFVVGDPRSASTTIGPLSNAGQQRTVLEHIEVATRTPGVRIIAQHSVEHLERGWYAPPTVVVADDHAAPIVQEEVFGPVLTIQPADDDEDALRLADATRFGLIARVWTEDAAVFDAAAQRLRVGGVIQSGSDVVWAAPFGGVKESGHGRERGIYGVEEYLVPKSVQPAR